MSLEYILKHVARAAGVRDLSAASEERSYLIDIINDAAEEVWEERDLPGSLRECYVAVTSNKILAFPPYIGELRAIRDANYDRLWELNDLRPRYHTYPWKTFYENLRHVGTAPVILESTNMAGLTVKIQNADASVVVTVVGPTETASRVKDEITLSDTENTGVINFVNPIESITLNKLAANDIEIYDAAGVRISYVLNTSTEARFLVYDISDYPTATGTAFNLEALYKMHLSKMTENHHAFPLQDYDKIIIMKAIQLLAEKEEGGEERALLMFQKIKQVQANKVHHKVGTIKNQMGFRPNPYLGRFDPRNYGWDE